MSRYLPYSPDQASLLPARVGDVLGSGHLCFFMHATVERLDLRRFHEAYSSEGGVLYHPSMMLKVWLYAYALGVTSSRRLERRIVEDLAFRFLAGGLEPDYWALNQFRRRHGLAINDCFTQVLELAREMGMRQLGTVAIDGTKIKASASPDKIVVLKRQERSRIRRKVRRWQQAANADDNNEGAGTQLAAGSDAVAAASMRPELEPLERPRKRSTTDPKARFMHTRRGYVLGYSAQIAVSDDHLIRGSAGDSEERGQRLSDADGRSADRHLRPAARTRRGRLRLLLQSESGTDGTCAIDAYVPDSNLARELNLGQPATDTIHQHPRLRQMRKKLRTAEGKQIYTRRKAIVEPVFGILKEQRGMRSFRMRGLSKVNTEFTLASIAYNLTRLHQHR